MNKDSLFFNMETYLADIMFGEWRNRRLFFIFEKWKKERLYKEKHMKEFKFWAIPYSVRQLLLIAFPFWVIFFTIIYFVDVEKHFFYIWLGLLIWVIPSYMLIVRRVRISFSETGDIRIFMNGRQKYEGSAELLEYVRGVNINNSRGRAALTMKFPDRKFRFSIFELTGIIAPKENQQVRLLKYMVSVFNLKPEIYQDTFMNQIYTYWNPGYKGDSSAQGYNKNER